MRLWLLWLFIEFRYKTCLLHFKISINRTDSLFHNVLHSFSFINLCNKTRLVLIHNGSPRSKIKYLNTAYIYSDELCSMAAMAVWVEVGMEIQWGHDRTLFLFAFMLASYCSLWYFFQVVEQVSCVAWGRHNSHAVFAYHFFLHHCDLCLTSLA